MQISVFCLLHLIQRIGNFVFLGKFRAATSAVTLFIGFIWPNYLVLPILSIIVFVYTDKPGTGISKSYLPYNSLLWNWWLASIAQFFNYLFAT